jgi:hypothetical protein
LPSASLKVRKDECLLLNGGAAAEAEHVEVVLGVCGARGTKKGRRIGVYTQFTMG